MKSVIHNEFPPRTIAELLHIKVYEEKLNTLQQIKNHIKELQVDIISLTGSKRYGDHNLRITYKKQLNEERKRKLHFHRYLCSLPCHRIYNNYKIYLNRKLIEVPCKLCHSPYVIESKRWKNHIRTMKHQKRTYKFIMGLHSTVNDDTFLVILKFVGYIY